MSIKRSEEMEFTPMGSHCKRSVVHLNDLMMVVLHFFDGPWAEPDPFHHHPHEQISYVASGEIIFSLEGEPDQKLKAGDVFAAPSDKPHRIQLLSKEATLIDNFTPLREEFI